MTNQLKKFPNDNVTCISPWYELRIDPNGDLRCCHSIRQAQAEQTNLSFLDWFRHDNKTRTNIINGVESIGCSACYYNEKNNLKIIQSFFFILISFVAVVLTAVIVNYLLEKPYFINSLLLF